MTEAALRYQFTSGADALATASLRAAFKLTHRPLYTHTVGAANSVWLVEQLCIAYEEIERLKEIESAYRDLCD